MTKIILSKNEALWDATFVFEETDKIIDTWYDIFNGILDKHAPVITKRIKTICQPKWFTGDLNNEIKKRDRNSRNPGDWMLFREVKNRVTLFVRNAKKALFKSQVVGNRNCPKKLWSMIRDLSRDSQERDCYVRELDEDGEIVTEDNRIAELFNSLFVNQATKILGSTDSYLPTESLSSFFKEIMDIKHAFELPFISPAKVLKMLQEIPSSKATGADSLSIRVLKIAAPGIASSVASLINYCISTRSFPSKWKMANVTPIFKNQGSKTDKQNYRPISVLPILSKIYERHIYDSLYAHLARNDFSYGFQSGF